jgi:hypothetical protein
VSDLHLSKIIPSGVSRQTLLDHPSCLLPLFHGTDRTIASMSQEERSELRTACGIVIDYLLPVYEENEFEKRTSQENQRDLQELYAKVVDRRGKAALRKSKNSLYSYDNVYLTFDPLKANIYAEDASVCGELGSIAYWLLRGAEKLGYELPMPSTSQKSALEKVRAAGMRKPDPILLCYMGIPKDRLQTEQGNPVDWEKIIDLFLKDFQYGVVRVLGDFDISDGMITTFKELRQMYGD